MTPQEHALEAYHAISLSLLYIALGHTEEAQANINLAKLHTDKATGKVNDETRR
jgi:hypothetical protein